MKRIDTYLARMYRTRQPAEGVVDTTELVRAVELVAEAPHKSVLLDRLKAKVEAFRTNADAWELAEAAEAAVELQSLLTIRHDNAGRFYRVVAYRDSYNRDPRRRRDILAQHRVSWQDVKAWGEARQAAYEAGLISHQAAYGVVQRSKQAG